MGRHACPRCLVKTDEISSLGTYEDDELRIEKRRVDNLARQHTVQHARKLIYERRNCIGSRKVNQLLEEQSLTPTVVRCFAIPLLIAPLTTL